MVARDSDPRAQLHLPPGFRFFPTDEELLVQYLCRKVAGYQFSLPIIGEIDLYKFNPWELPDKALFGEKEWYFFSPRERKYPNGSRPNRVAGTGYWKATGTDKTITTEGRKVGIKKALVFYIGKAPNGRKTNWIMHEYRLSDSGKKSSSKRLDDWVLCRIYMKNFGGRKAASNELSQGDSSPSSSCQYDDVLDSLPEINNGFFNLLPLDSLNMVEDQKPINLQPFTSGNFFDYSSISVFGSPGSELFRYEDAAATEGSSGIRNDVVAPAANVDTEVRNGRGNQRLNLLAHSFNESFDPAWAHSAQNIGFGFQKSI